MLLQNSELYFFEIFFCKNNIVAFQEKENELA